MRNIWTVFKTDIKSLSRCFFAMAVAVAITILPSLYAWLNIYSNWDPYGNTGNISIGLYSGDEGCIEDGEYVNMGQNIVDDLREATSINWVVCDSSQQAIDGVYSGEYYASVVIDADFSYKMFNMLTKWTGKPSLTYYENAKKNAVATKITDTAVDSVRRTVSEAYLEVVVNAIMKQGNEIAATLTDDEAVSLATVLDDTKTTINSCVRTIDAFAAASGNSSGVSIPTIDSSKLEELLNTIGSSTFPNSSITDINIAIYNAYEKAMKALEDYKNFIQGTIPGTNLEISASSAAEAMGEIADTLNAWADAIKQDGTFDQITISAVEETAYLCERLQNYFTQIAAGGTGFDITQVNDLLTDLINHAAKLIPTAQGLRDDIAVTIGGKAYTGFTAQVNDDGTTTYTIPGADITGEIVINSNKQVKLPETYKVTFAGTGAGDATGESTVQEKANYTFTVAKQKNFEYTITATMGGKDVTITEGADNTYTIANVTGDLVITIEKKSTLTMEVAVSEYVQMDNKTVFLVTVTGTPEEGKAFAYGDNVMYKTTAYGENVYSWLVIVDKNEVFTVATAEANINQASATAEEVKQSYDVNETGVVDINDAQLTYDIYSGKYTDFEKVSVRKFLRADVNLDKAVNSTDAVAVVKNSK